jgi:methylated-DNA-[protein]-cysteine S-methyltransferase
MNGFALFDTAIGMCALAWGPQGLVGVQLPADMGEPATRARMKQRFPELSEMVPTEIAQRAVVAIQGLLQGAHDNLLHIELDMRGVSEFHQRIYAIARRIPPGQTRTYGEIALGTRRQDTVARRRPGHGPQPFRAGGALPPRAGRGQQARRFLGRRRRIDQAAHARYRGRAAERHGVAVLAQWAALIQILRHCLRMERIGEN